MSYEDKINLYGGGPVIIAFMIYLPVLFVRKVSPRSILKSRYHRLCTLDWLYRCFGKKESGLDPETGARSSGQEKSEEEIAQELQELQKYNSHVRERVWFWLLFWCFLIYPLLSIFATSGFVCTTVGDKRYLLIDFNIECPLNNGADPLFWKIVALLFVYPFGLPVFFMWTLWRHEVPRLANIKYKNLLFIEVLKEFKARMDGDQLRSFMSKISVLLKAKEYQKNRLLITKNLTAIELECILEHDWWKGTSDEMQDVEIARMHWIRPRDIEGDGNTVNRSSKEEAVAGEMISEIASQATQAEPTEPTGTTRNRPNLQQQTLDCLTSWFWEMEEAKKSVQDASQWKHRMLKKMYETRQAWCKILYKWVDELEEF
eukprot:768791-Hanusia_phi.AAC.1